MRAGAESGMLASLLLRTVHTYTCMRHACMHRRSPSPGGRPPPHCSFCSGRSVCGTAHVLTIRIHNGVDAHPAGTAVSTAAELQAALAASKGELLRMQAEVIHLNATLQQAHAQRAHLDAQVQDLATRCVWRWRSQAARRERAVTRVKHLYPRQRDWGW